jgi:membrane-associated phospholipid phosphatase
MHRDGMDTSDARIGWRLFNLGWIPVLAMTAALMASVAFTRFSIAPVSFGVMAAIAAALAVAAYRAANTSAPDPRRILLPGVAAQTILLTIVAGPLSYVALAASVDFPLQDQHFLAIDNALGFDARGIILFVNDHQWLSLGLHLAYGMIKWPLLGIPILLSMTGRFERLQQYMLALSLALLATLVASVFVPAIGNYEGLRLDVATLPNIDTSVFLGCQRDIPAVRDGSLRHLELLQLSGIVALPSFHAASSLLFAWALYPVRIVGPAMLAVNAVMIASTPVIGGHYLIDVIAGVAVAVGAIMAALRCAQYLRRDAVSRAQGFMVPAE